MNIVSLFINVIKTMYYVLIIQEKIEFWLLGFIVKGIKNIFNKFEPHLTLSWKKNFNTFY